MIWGKQKVVRLISLASANKSVGYIADIFGCSTEDVIAKADEINLEIGAHSKPKLSRGQAMRTCLPCGNPFLSDGPGNRICRNCKQTANEARSGFDSHYLGSLSNY